MKHDAIGHQIIMASAGTGKTYTLTGRIIRLLACGVPLERIVALTFTRAAAGEIFDTLVKRLAEAAAQPEKHTELTAEIARTTAADAVDVTGMLRDVIARMHLSPIGTLDSFFVKMVRLFPFEFCTGGDFGVLQGHALEVEIQRVLRRILVTGAPAESSSMQEFLEAFKRATFGAEEKRLHDLLEQFVNSYHELFLNAAEPETWGNAERIWAHEPPWWKRLDQAALTATVCTFRDGVMALEPTEKQVDRWTDFLTMVERFEPGSMITKPADDVLKKLLACLDDLRRGSAEITVQRKKVHLPPSLCAPALDLLGHLVACTVIGRLEATRGLRDILASYEEVYDRWVRQAGRMAFSDVTHLVTRGIDPGARRHVEYRLDGRYDHWAIDEFQDTSRQQWRGIAPLVEEVIQDPGGQRTFFAVGDVKQAIYGWRGGDSRLLSEVRDYYDIAEKPLTDSYRCGPAVVAMVNRIFDTLGAAGLPEAVAQRWQDSWRTHRSAKPERQGCAQLLEVSPGPASRSVKSEDWHRCIAEKLQEISPWTRGLSTAVLVRSNDQGAKLTEALRTAGIPTVWTGDKGIDDNPVVFAFLDLFRCARHPGNTLAWNHLCMTPLGDIVAQTPGGGPDSLVQSILRDVHARGFADAVEAWMMSLETLMTLDSFSRQRLRALLDAAEAFDRTGSRSCLDFADFVESYTVSDIAADRTVQVMTIHRSKGLGFDVTMIPVFPGTHGLDSLVNPDVLLGPRYAGEMTHEWLLLSPPKAVALADNTTATALRKASETACFEDLCVLYVAMTRAKHALYLFVPTPPKRPGALHLHTLVRQQLTGTATASDAVPMTLDEPNWYQALPQLRPCLTEPREDSSSTQEVALQRRRHRRRSPSDHRLGESAAAELFRPASRAGLRFGSTIHACFEALTWVEKEPVDTMIDRWRGGLMLPEPLAEAVEAVVRRALASTEVAAELSHPGQPCELWRERSFEMILDGEWVSGTFDRVVILKSRTEEAQSARILDYKSDRISGADGLAEAVERYREQLELYRRALSGLIGLSRERITARLLFTDVGRVVTV